MYMPHHIQDAGMRTADEDYQPPFCLHCETYLVGEIVGRRLWRRTFDETPRYRFKRMDTRKVSHEPAAIRKRQQAAADLLRNGVFSQKLLAEA